MAEPRFAIHEMDPPVARAAANLAAAKEMIAIAAERALAHNPDPQSWSGADMAQMFLTSAWFASVTTDKPMSRTDFAELLRCYAEMVEADWWCHVV